MKNWFGMTPHQTDTCIHWSSNNAHDQARVFRAAYDKIAAKGLKKELEILLQAAYAAGSDDSREFLAGEDV